MPKRSKNIYIIYNFVCIHSNLPSFHSKPWAELSASVDRFQKFRGNNKEIFVSNAIEYRKLTGGRTCTVSNLRIRTICL